MSKEMHDNIGNSGSDANTGLCLNSGGDGNCSYELVRYGDEYAAQWDDFVETARNSSFLFMRRFISYHADRFQDCSWLAFKNGKLIALLPANIDAGNVLHSHQGLTYGGWILPVAHIDGSDLLEIFRIASRIWRKLGITALDYKPLPYIYAASPAQEDLYALFRLNANISEVNLSMSIDLDRLRRIATDRGVTFEEAVKANYNKLRRRSLTKAEKLDFEILETETASDIITMVSDCLRERYNSSPVHTTEELQMLHDRFPDRIHFHILKYLSKPQACVCIFDTGIVAHAQYIATTPLGRELNLLTPLFHHLISTTYANRKYFDFGTSNECHGEILNSGLLRQKASYGASAVAYPRYYLSLT